MEGRYTENHAICGTAGKSLHYPDFDLFEKRSENINRSSEKSPEKSRRTRKVCKKSRKKNSPAPSSVTFYRRRLVQLLFIAIVLTFLFGSIGVHADPIETAHNEDELFYKVITVEKGDTLWDIADTWFESTGDNIRTYINNLKTMNHLHGDQIQEGQLLLIYYGDSAEDIITANEG